MNADIFTKRLRKNLSVYYPSGEANHYNDDGGVPSEWEDYYIGTIALPQMPEPPEP